MSVTTDWGLAFLGGYVLLMLGFGVFGWQRIRNGVGGRSRQDEYATARSGFGSLTLSLAWAATATSGVAFLGIPALAYTAGFKGGYYAIPAAAGIFIGMLLVARLTKAYADRFGSQSVPDLLGDRLESPALRIVTAALASLLIFYAMGQVAAAGWMFDVVLGVDYGVGIWITGGLLLAYMVVGGSHADIITDSVQGAIMILIAVLVVVMFATGWGFDGGVASVNAALDPGQQWDTHTDPDHPLFNSWWAIGLLFLAHIGFTVQPQLGNKYIAIDEAGSMRQFMLFAAAVLLLYVLMFLGGILGAAQGIQADNPDAIIPLLFVENLPPIAAAFLGVAILSAIVSTADGLILSLSQVIANDLYRKSYVPWRGGDPESEAAHSTALTISRVTTVAATLIAVVGVITPPTYLALLVWTGIGGIIVTYGGPLLLGLFWDRTTGRAALAGVAASFAAYFLLHLGPQLGLYEGLWPFSQNPFISTCLGLFVSVAVTGVGSLLTSVPRAERSGQPAASGSDPGED